MQVFFYLSSINMESYCCQHVDMVCRASPVILQASSRKITFSFSGRGIYLNKFFSNSLMIISARNNFNDSIKTLSNTHLIIFLKVHTVYIGILFRNIELYCYYNKKLYVMTLAPAKVSMGSQFSNISRMKY
jgi:hypothetical protein